MVKAPFLADNLKLLMNMNLIAMIQEYLNLTDYAVGQIRKIANSTSRDAGYTRAFYSYPAKFLSHLPRELIKMFSVKDDLVYDAYCGGGTTALEAMLLKRHSVSYDINPFAILIAKVKTCRLDLELANSLKLRTLDLQNQSVSKLLDSGDEELLGKRMALEISEIAANIEQLDSDIEYKDFFKLALIHAIKMVGRRDFRGRKSTKIQSSITAFLDSKSALPLGTSIVSIYKRKIDSMLKEMASLPISREYAPKLFLGPNAKTCLESQSVDLIITSPPYKDLDIEYMQLQIQRPEAHKSKRSQIIAKLLGVSPVPKDVLRGGLGEKYWETLFPSLTECHRVSKRGALAFFWIGFKTIEDKVQFEQCLKDTGFVIRESIEVRLSNDRAASSRSVHHGRETNMLKKDWLFVTWRE